MIATSAPPSPPERITDADDPRICVFRNVRERDLVGRQGIFIAEGLSVLTALLTRSHCERLSILVEEGRAARLTVLAERGATPLYVAPQAVIDRIAGFHLHRGILAAGRVPPSPPLASILERRPHAPLRLPVLVGLSNHDNVGGAYRNAAAFGACGVVVDPHTADPFYRKAIRVGVGAPLVVPTVRMAAAELIEAARAANVTVYALTPRAERAVGETALAPRAAFLLGTEGPGLPDALVKSATPLAVRIGSDLDSLNVATTSGIVLHAHAACHGLAPHR